MSKKKTSLTQLAIIAGLVWAGWNWLSGDDEGDAIGARETPGMYKVVKISRGSGKRQVIERNLTQEQAQRLVKSFPNSQKSMVVYYKQGD